MSKLMEDRLIDNTNQVRIQVAVDMLTDGGYSNEQIAKISKLALSEIEEIAKQLQTAKAQ